MSWEFKSPATHRRPIARAKAAFRNMRQRCGNANGKNPSYSDVNLLMTEEEWLAWALPRYEAFLAENPDGSPCVARKNDTGHYVIGNIEIISVEENRIRQQRDRPAALTHGSLSSYRYCKCEICRAARRDYMRQRRSTKTTL